MAPLCSPDRFSVVAPWPRFSATPHNPSYPSPKGDLEARIAHVSSLLFLAVVKQERQRISALQHNSAPPPRYATTPLHSDSPSSPYRGMSAASSSVVSAGGGRRKKDEQTVAAPRVKGKCGGSGAPEEISEATFYDREARGGHADVPLE